MDLGHRDKVLKLTFKIDKYVMGELVDVGMNNKLDQKFVYINCLNRGWYIVRLAKLDWGERNG